MNRFFLSMSTALSLTRPWCVHYINITCMSNLATFYSLLANFMYFSCVYSILWLLNVRHFPSTLTLFIIPAVRATNDTFWIQYEFMWWRLNIITEIPYSYCVLSQYLLRFVTWTMVQQTNSCDIPKYVYSCAPFMRMKGKICRMVARRRLHQPPHAII